MKIFSFILGIIFCLSIESSLNVDFSQLLKDTMVHFPQKDGVLILTTQTIDEALKTYPKLAILFFTPWCPHCKAFYPEIVEALKSNEMKKMGVVFGKVDIEYNQKTAEDFNIYGMPTVLYFENGIKKEVYNGGRNAKNIVEWFYKRLISKYHLLKSLEEIKTYENPNEHRFIYFGNDKKKISEYEKFIDEEGETIFGLVKDEKLIKSYGKSPDTVVLYKNFDSPPYVDIKNIDVENLKKELELNRFPLMYDDCNSLMGVIFSTNLPCILLFRNDGDNKKTPSLDKTFTSLANKFRSKILFCKSDINSDFGKRIIRVANLTQANAEKNEPTSIIFDFVKGFNKWRFEDFFKECNSKNLEQFLQDWIDGKIKPPIRSEEIPVKQEGPVFKLVNKSFKKEVLDNDLNVFVKFYSPNCPHCIKLQPDYIELAKKLQYNKNVIIAEYNLKENDFDWFSIRGYPTLVLFKAGDKENHIVYKGNRTVEDMMSFVISNSGNTEEIIKKKEEERKRKIEEEEKKKREEEERKRKREEEARKKREEEAKKKREEEERKRKIEEEKKKKEEEAKRKREEEERKRKIEEENKKKEEEAKKKREEEERKRKIEEEKKKKEEEAKKKREEEERKRKIEEEKKKKEEEAKKKREEEERKRKIEEEKKKKEEEAKKKKEEVKKNEKEKDL